MMNKKSKDKKQKTLENENEEEGGRGKASNNRNDNKQSTGMSITVVWGQDSPEGGLTEERKKKGPTAGAAYGVYIYFIPPPHPWDTGIIEMQTRCLMSLACERVSREREKK